eukprot:gene4974-4873_t
MAKAVRFYETGGPEVLRYEDVEVGDPGPGQVRLRHVAVGLNYADTYFRNGTYPIPMPNGMGVEASGVVQAIGEGVTNVQVGDRVTYTGFLNTLGAYSTERLIAAAPLIKLPETISFETAAAMTMRGLTSSYLMRRIYDFKEGDSILLHAAAGGVGLIVSQWAKLLGLNVIGTVSTEQKAEIARAHGCDHTINYSHEDVAARVRELTDGVGVNVVFDSVGKNTFMGSLDSLKPRGLMVCVGTASGPIPAFDPVMLAMKGSLYLTRPALANYISDPAEKATLAGELFDHVGSGRIKIEINQHYALQDAVQAHLEQLTYSIGAELIGVNLADAVHDDGLFAEIRAQLLKHRVVFLRDQDITRAEHVAFARRFGELEDHPVAGSDPEHPGLVRIYKNPDQPMDRYENAWHTDATWRDAPPMGCVLRCVECPPVGGDTMWANMVEAYARLPEDVKLKIADLRARHSIEASFGAAMPIEKRLALKAMYPDAEHPVVRTHPETGEKVLFVNAFTTHLSNYHTPERVRFGQDANPGASELLRYLISQAYIPEYQVRWRWKPNSIAIWDNRSTQHYAVMDYPPCHRKMERAGIIGDKTY